MFNRKFIISVYKLVSTFYTDFTKDEEENLWKSEEELRNFINIEKSLSLI